MLRAFKIIASRSIYAVYKASTKVTALFCTAIAFTVAGGAYTIFSGSGIPAPSAYDDYERFPASASSSDSRAYNFGNVTGGSASKGGASYPSMPADYADRTNAQENRDAPATPVSVIEPSQASSAQGITSVNQMAALAGQLPPLQDGDSTSTSTSTSTNATEATAVASASTATSTTTATSTGPAGFLVNHEIVGWLGVCQKISVTLLNSSFAAVAAPGRLTIALSTSYGVTYADSSCLSPSTAIFLEAGVSAIDYYFRSDTAAEAALTTNVIEYGVQTAAINVGVPTSTVVVGQQLFTTNNVNDGGLSAKSLRNPNSSARVGDKLIVADYENHRVLIWNSVPTSNFDDADVVLGQSLFTTANVNHGGLSDSSLFYPAYVHTDGTRLFVADQSNNRVLVWNTIPTTSNDAADYVLGQPGFGTNGANQGGISYSTMSAPSCIHSDGTRLLVCDSGNNRVLIWDSIPTTTTAATRVIGQANDAASGNGSGANELDGPYFAIFSGGKLLVSDYNNNRVLLWSTLPTSDGAAADTAIGQVDTTSNGPGTTQATLNGPADMRVDDNGRLLVADLTNNRVLVWNKLPTSSGASADGVIGQSSFTAGGANAGGISTTSLFEPWGLDVFGSELWVSDLSNNRMLFYTLP